MTTLTAPQPRNDSPVALMLPEDAESYLDLHHGSLPACSRRVLSGLASMTEYYEVPSHNLAVVYQQISDEMSSRRGLRTVYRRVTPIITHTNGDVMYNDVVPHDLIQPQQAMTVAEVYRASTMNLPHAVMFALETIGSMSDSYQVDTYRFGQHLSTYRSSTIHSAFTIAKENLYHGHGVQLTVEFAHQI